MSRLYNTFDFVGKIVIPKDNSKFHDINFNESKGWEGHRLNFAIQESKNNSVFLEMYGGYSKTKPNKVFSFSKGTESVKGTNLEIPWEDRLNEETVDMVASFKKIVVDFTTDEKLKEEIRKLLYDIFVLEFQDSLTEAEKNKLSELKQELKLKSADRHEFIHEYDAIQFLSSQLEKYKEHKFRVTGDIVYQEHKGRYFRKFKPTHLEIVSDDEVSKLRATMDIFFTKDSLDDKDFKKDKKVYINGYVISYDSKTKKDQFFPQQVVINAQKIDFDNEAHVGRFEYLKNQFEVKGKGVYHLQWQVNIFRGAENVDITYDDLTQKQKEAIEFGLNKLEDFVPKGGVLGENTEENRLVKPNLQFVDDQNDFRDGAIESSYDVDDLIYVPAVNQQKETKQDPSESEKNKADAPKLDDLDNLFG